MLRPTSYAGLKATGILILFVWLPALVLGQVTFCRLNGKTCDSPLTTAWWIDMNGHLGVYKTKISIE